MCMGQLETLIQETVAALTILDAGHLTRLRREIDALAAIGVSPDENLVAAMLANRLLGELLRETERNLRMFRATSPCIGQLDTDTYGTLALSSELAKG